MQIADKIVKTLPVLDINDTLSNAIDFFVETTYSHVAVTEEGAFLGCISENDLACLEHHLPIHSFRHELEAFFVKPDISWLDLLEKFSRNEANLMPVISQESRVIGYFDLNDVVDSFIGTPFFTEPGGILVVEKGLRDYAFSEIAQIVETNNTRLLGAFVTDSANEMIQVTLKIAAANLNEVSQTFRRYGYSIVYGNSDDQFLEDLKERSDYLDKYLNV